MVTTISQTWSFRAHVPHVGEEINTIKSGINDDTKPFAIVISSQDSEVGFLLKMNLHSITWDGRV